MPRAPGPGPIGYSPSVYEPRPTRRTLLRAAAAGLLTSLSPGTARSQPDERVLGEGRSRYNHVRVTERGSVRTMYFVGDDGTQYIETRVDRAYPASLDLDVFRTMMAGFLLTPRPASALILGLGGGAIANYLHARVAGLDLDAVDIDPEVVRLAKDHFDVPREHPRYRCHVADARQFLERAPAEQRWDMIFLDAFRGVHVPYHLKTAEFHAAVLARLSPHGVVVANLHNATPMYPHDRATFAAVYPTRYSFLSEAGNQTTLVFDHCPLQFDLPAGQLSGLLLQSNHLVGLRVQFAQFGLEAGDTGLGPSDPFGQPFPFGARLSRGGPIAVPLRHDPFPQPVVMVVLVSTSSRQVQCPPQ